MRPARHGLQGGLTRRNGWRWEGRGCRGVSRRTDRRFRCGWSFPTVCVADSWFHTYALLGMPCSILHSNESDSWRAGNVVTGCLGWNIPVTPWPPHEQKQPAREAWWRGEACKRITPVYFTINRGGQTLVHASHRRGAPVSRGTSPWCDLTAPRLVLCNGVTTPAGRETVSRTPPTQWNNTPVSPPARIQPSHSIPQATTTCH